VEILGGRAREAKSWRRTTASSRAGRDWGEPGTVPRDAEQARFQILGFEADQGRCRPADSGAERRSACQGRFSESSGRSEPSARANRHEALFRRGSVVPAAAEPSAKDRGDTECHDGNKQALGDVIAAIVEWVRAEVLAFARRDANERLGRCSRYFAWRARCQLADSPARARPGEARRPRPAPGGERASASAASAVASVPGGTLGPYLVCDRAAGSRSGRTGERRRARMLRAGARRGMVKSEWSRCAVDGRARRDRPVTLRSVGNDFASSQHNRREKGKAVVLRYFEDAAKLRGATASRSAARRRCFGSKRAQPAWRLVVVGRARAERRAEL